MPEGGRFVERKSPLSQPERPLSADRRDFWNAERMEQRHANAVRIVNMERAAVEGGEALETFLAELEQSNISERRKTVMREVVKKYDDQCARIASLDKKYRGPENKNDAELGSTLFTARAGEAPDGTVTAFAREGYFILYCHLRKDYLRLTKGSESGGTYHRAVKISDSDRAPVLAVNGKPGEGGDTIDHERQHWINDVLLTSFEEAERAQPRFAEHDSRETTQEKVLRYLDRLADRRIKDELLAYLRDGSKGNWIQLSLNSNLYAHLFEKDTERRKNAVKEFCDVMKAYAYELESPESRATIVAQLLDTPLDRMPQMLERVANFYERRKRETRHAEIDSLVVSYAEEVYDRLFPREVEPARKKLITDYRTHLSKLQELQEMVFGSNGVAVTLPQLRAHSERLGIAADEIADQAKAITRLRHNNALVPSLDLEYIDDDPRARNWRPRAEQAGLDLLDAAKTVPQNVIDRAYREAARTDDYRRESDINELRQRLSQALEAAGGSFTVDDIVAYHEPYGLRVTVRRHATEKYPEVPYTLHLHPSISY